MDQKFNCILSLGSNLDNRYEQLRTAYQLINEKIGNVVHQSSIYESEPWGAAGQPAFLNQVLLVQTTLEAETLLDELKEIEIQMGRTKGKKWSARIIDLDILFYKDLVIKSSKLTIPHKNIQNRNFILVPLMEVLPEYVHPVLDQSIRSLYFDCKDHLNVYLNEI